MDIQLKSQNREKKEKLSVDFVPAVLYGRGVASVSLKVKRSELDKVVNKAGESNLIALETEAGTVKVLIKEVQRNGITSNLIHVDFFQVNMTSKITTEIPLNFIGESKAVREMAGFLIKNLDALEVECLPGNLVDHIDIDISVLKEFHDEILTSDLVLPLGIELSSDVVRAIITVTPPRIQEEEPVEVAPVVATKEEPKTENKDNK